MNDRKISTLIRMHSIMYGFHFRLTIKAKCPMELKSFPMDRQSCPLIMGSYAYTSKDLIYQWQNEASVNFVPGMTLSQFDLMSFPYRNFTFTRREGDFSVLQVSFNLQRHTGYFLIQVYVPCILIVVLSWVSFWIHREATSDRVGLGITTVLTLSTISLDSRTDLPKVRYATALDWFLLMSFFYCIATLLEFAGVHYFTKNSSIHYESRKTSLTSSPQLPAPVRLTMERTTQTENRLPKWKQFLYCLKGDEKFRKQRQREAANSGNNGNGHSNVRHINSVSLIDRASRILFPASFGVFNLFYWMVYFMAQDDFKWGDTKLNSLNH
ncbi:unnamed protein product [Brassicogethes aeneus]|uniref:Uncharacterized protein n=1 Tax=Brassicogethes aeneus TaxID=1431903 RepID=A0A9P0BER7_BRAAE|nr:unnamed protein product [Brassicogethes aeneus]